MLQKQSQPMYIPGGAIQEPTHSHYKQNATHNSDAGTSMEGWLYLKTRSTVNVKPRLRRYCILIGKTLRTYKFLPNKLQLITGEIRAVKEYQVCKVENLEGSQGWGLSRNYGFLISVIIVPEGRMAQLEANANSDDQRVAWVTKLVMAISLNSRTEDSPSTNANKSSLNKQTVGGKDNATLQAQQKEKSKFQIDSPIKKHSPEILQLGASIHRGLGNKSGENNCFLNVIIQSFWHLRSFRRLLLNVNISDDDNSSSMKVLRSLKDIMLAYEDTSSGQLHPSALRAGLSELYAANKKFQEGEMADAEETMLSLLSLVHQTSEKIHIHDSDKEQIRRSPLMAPVSTTDTNIQDDMCFDPESIPHAVFNHQIYDRTVCPKCGGTSQWDLYSDLLYSVYAAELTEKKFDSLEAILKQQPENKDINRSCDVNECKGNLVVERIIKRFPMVFAFSLLWATDSVSTVGIENLMNIVQESIDLAKAFHPSGSSILQCTQRGIDTQYILKGLVCYYGKHYFAFFYSTAHKAWILFDDSKVTEVGSLNDVKTKCIKGRYQPVLIFYEIQTGRKDSSVELESLELGVSPHSTDSKDTSRGNSYGRSRSRTLSDQGRALLVEVLSPQVPIAPSQQTINETEYIVNFGPSETVLGLYLENIQGKLVVTKFPKGSNGEIFAAEKCECIRIMDEVVTANDHQIGDHTVQQAVNLIQTLKRPLHIKFRRSSMVNQLEEMGFSSDLATRALMHCGYNIQAAANMCSENLKSQK